MDVLSFFPQKRKNQRKNSRFVPCSIKGLCLGRGTATEQANAGFQDGKERSAQQL